MKLAFLGLGVMGYPMAGHLKQAGFDVCVYNRTTEKAIKWAEQYNACYEKTPALAVQDANIVLLCLGNDADVSEVIYKEQGVLSGLAQKTLVIDHTTTSDHFAKNLAQALHKQGHRFLDAPVSGGQAGAENGQLSVMVGGGESVFEQAVPIMKSYSKTMTYMGSSGAGQATKMVNQILAVGVLQGMAEGFALAEKSGLDITRVVDAISGGAAGSWQLSQRGSTITQNKFDHGFAVDWMRKDLGFCLEAAKRYGITLPNTQWVDQCYEQLQQQGYHRADTSVLVKQYDNLAG